MKTKTYGWVHQDTHEEKPGIWFVKGDCNISKKISTAEVCSTRKEARTRANRLSTDVIRKVEINKNGKAVKIIPGR